MLAASATALAAARVPLLNQAGPPPAHTGAFGEPTCHECHFDYPLNAEPGAAITLELPEKYERGQTYTLRLRVQHAELKRGGFQLSARFEDGTQAGTFVPADTTVIRVQRANAVEYASHTLLSTDNVQGNSIAWDIGWRAPDAGGAVVFHIATNVANADVSEFGDRIFTASRIVTPSK